MTERWGIYEIELNGPTDGNPFLEVQLSARFQLDDRVFEPQGFYDGEGIYRIRFSCQMKLGSGTILPEVIYLT